MDCQGAARGATSCVMKAKDEKAERLAAALRVNLRRRKAQARGGDAGEAVNSPVPLEGQLRDGESGAD